jgi:hypothetical protein
MRSPAFNTATRLIRYSIHGRIMDAGMIVTVLLLITVLLFQRLRRSPAGFADRRRIDPWLTPRWSSVNFSATDLSNRSQ